MVVTFPSSFCSCSLSKSRHLRNAGLIKNFKYPRLYQIISVILSIHVVSTRTPENLLGSRAQALKIDICPRIIGVNCSPVSGNGLLPNGEKLLAVMIMLTHSFFTI